jgi:uncharacterized protein YndB with AHSA1/START domain
MSLPKITVQTTINISLSEAWNCWTNPELITNWNFASDDWHCPKASNDLIEDGKFSYTMASKDGSMSFDFDGKFSLIDEPNRIHYLLDDNRKVEISFKQEDDHVILTEVFEAETENSLELQQAGWQAILDNFKKFAEK